VRNSSLAAPVQPAAPGRGAARVQRLWSQAQAFGRAGRWVEARRCYGQLAALAPGQALAHFRLGMAHQALGEREPAVCAYRRALECEPGHADARLNLGHLLAELGQPAQALAHYEQFIALNPARAAVHVHRADVLRQLDRAQAALDSYDQAAALDAVCFEAHFNKAGLLLAMGQHAQALAHYTRVLEIRPELADAFSNRGNVFLAMGRLEEALRDYDHAIALRPGLAMAYNNRANTLQELWRYEEAIADYDRALRLDPGLAAAHSNRGNSLKKLNRLPEAVQSYANALALKPDNVKANFNAALARLLQGDFARGWRQYEWRWKDELKHRQRHYPQPLWLGGGDFSELAGKAVLVYFEQGFGDTLQFCRYASVLARHGARVLLEVQPPLFALLRNLDGVSRLLQSRAAGGPPDFELHCPLMSLPLAFGTDEAGIPQKTPYVFADTAKAARWQARLGTYPGPRVGLVSAGSATHRNDASRSLPLAQLLGAVPPGWTGVCLHKELRSADAALWAEHRELLFFGPELHDFAETAALVAGLDLVLTVDTSVAHLAAAMGKPTWVMLPFSPDWRWQLERTDSPWYPSVRLFRQTAPGDWAGVLAQVAAAMRAFAPEAAKRAHVLASRCFLTSTVK
jgi:tetratricopeptide (TPR) repeat protein